MPRSSFSTVDLEKPTHVAKTVAFLQHRVGSFPMVKGDNMEQFFLQKNAAGACQKCRSPSVCSASLFPTASASVPLSTPFFLLTFFPWRFLG